MKKIKVIFIVFFMMLLCNVFYNNFIYATEENIPASIITLKIGEDIYDVNTLEEAIGKIKSGDVATIKLNEDIKMSQKITVLKNTSISIVSEDSNKITRGLTNKNETYIGQLFAVEEGAELYLENIVIDGENNWTLNKDVYEDALLNKKSISDVYTLIASEEGSPASNAWMFSNKGKITIDNVEIKNNYNKSGYGLFNDAEGSILIIKDSIIRHNAIPTNGSLVTYVTGKDTKAYIEEGTIIDDNFVGGNGGLFKIYSGAEVIINGGEITNNKAVNTNGVVSMTYGAGSTLILNDGMISENSGVSGKNNGRNAPIYIHNSGGFIMNGGAIKNNRGQSCGGIDSNGSANSKIQLNAGIIESNYVSDAYVARSDIHIPNDFDLVIGEDMQIVGNLTVSGGITNNGTIEGLISLNLQNNPDEVPISGTGVINGDVIVYHSEEEPEEKEFDMVDGYVVYCGPTEVVLTTLYKENVDNNKRNYNMVAVEKTTVDVPERVYPVKTGYTFLGWYEDEALTNPWNEEQDMFSATKKLYASWQINTYKVTWIVDGVKKVTEVVYDDEIIPIDTPSKAGHDFAGWDGYEAGMKMPAKDITITAKWNAHPARGIVSSLSTNVKKKIYNKKKVTNEIVIEDEEIEEVEIKEPEEVVEDKINAGNENNYETSIVKKKEKKCCWICWLILLIIILIIIYIKYRKDEEKRNQKSNRISKWKR